MDIVRNTFNGGTFEMDYAVFGAGRIPFVILPGMSLHPVTPSAQAVAARYSQFLDKCRCYLFDRRRNLPEGFSVQDMAEDTVAVMRALGIADAFVFGASQGAMMAMTIAARHPELVGRLALCSTAARPSERTVDTMSAWISLAEAGDAVALNNAIFSRVYSPGFRARYEGAFAALAREGTQAEMREFAVSAKATMTFDLWRELSEIKCPLSVFGVDDDTVLGGQGVKDIATRLGCDPFIYPGQGHAVYDEAPDFPDRLHSLIPAGQSDIVE